MFLILANNLFLTILSFERRRKDNWARPLSGEDGKQIGDSRKDLIVDNLVSSEYMLNEKEERVT